MRLAASGDVHARKGDADRIRGLFEDVRHRADALALLGDLTDHGQPEQAEALARGLSDVSVPVLAVLGNHDHDAGAVEDLKRILRNSGIQLLDRETTTLGEVGFVGVKGFGGGFGKGVVRAFGEAALKQFVTESVVEAEALRAGLKGLGTPRKVALLHYAPVAETLQGEPEHLFPFLGTTRLAQALDEGGATLALHGHAHHGAPLGMTPGGVPVHNVSIPVLQAAGHKDAYVVLDA